MGCSGNHAGFSGDIDDSRNTITRRGRRRCITTRDGSQPGDESGEYLVGLPRETEAFRRTRSGETAPPRMVTSPAPVSIVMSRLRLTIFRQAFGALALSLGILGQASAGSITYSIQNYPIDQNGAVLNGTIVTNGAIGTLTVSDILSWTWTIIPPGGSAVTVSSADAGSSASVQQLVIASQTGITIAGMHYPDQPVRWSSRALNVPISSMTGALRAGLSRDRSRSNGLGQL